MTWAAAGTLAGGRGKECTPPGHTANASRVPSAHPDHVVRVMAPECAAALFAGHLSAACSWPTSVVIGSDSTLPWSPGL